jgi:DNA replication and repair protein RecF
VPLRITRLHLDNFRSYSSFDVEPGEKITIIVGPNAVGKTNIIEAIQLLTSASSFRNPAWGECVRWGADHASLVLQTEGTVRKRETRLVISSAGKREYSVNGTSKRKVSEVAGVLPCVVFTPDDLRIVKDSAERRRAAIDGVGDQLSHAYLALRGEYERTVRQRNAALKDGSPDEAVIHALTERLTDRGVAFSGHRKRLFSRLSSRITEVYSELSPGEHLEAAYESSWAKRGVEESSSTAFKEALLLSRAEERARGATLVGPHRDEVLFTIDGKDSRLYASQGQQRTIALAWKLAEVSVITDVGGQPPTLLLDDVMSELDGARRHALASFVGEAAQTFVTTTNIGYFEQSMIDRAKLVSLQG